MFNLYKRYINKIKELEKENEKIKESYNKLNDKFLDHVNKDSSKSKEYLDKINVLTIELETKEKCYNELLVDYQNKSAELSKLKTEYQVLMLQKADFSIVQAEVIDENNRLKKEVYELSDKLYEASKKLRGDE